MGTTLVMVAVILTIVLGFVLLLLAELYCSLLLCRLRNRAPATTNDTAQLQQIQQPNAPSLSGIYAQGVLHAPRTLLFPFDLDLEKQFQQSQTACDYPPASSSGHDGLRCSTSKEDPIYICNPIYYKEEICLGKVDTPLEMPPSPSSLPITPMKKLPAEASSVCMRDARSLCITGSDSNSRNDCISSSLSGSPCTSPSW